MFDRVLNTLYIINNSRKLLLFHKKDKLGVKEFECLFTVTMEIKDRAEVYMLAALPLFSDLCQNCNKTLDNLWLIIINILNIHISVEMIVKRNHTEEVIKFTAQALFC